MKKFTYDEFIYDYLKLSRFSLYVGTSDKRGKDSLLIIVKSRKVVRDVSRQVSGLSSKVQGLSMSATTGKVQITVVIEISINGKGICPQMLQDRNPYWVVKPFFSKYDPDACYLDDLKPVFGDKFFCDVGLDEMKEEALELAEALAYEKWNIFSFEIHKPMRIALAYCFGFICLYLI